MEKLAALPFEDLGFACIDHHRQIRCGFPEVIYCPGKTTEQIVKIFSSLAKKGNKDKIPLPIPMQHSKDLNFSFSGLKTAAMYIIKKKKLTKQFTYDMAASFQQAIALSLTTKLTKAINQHQPKAILLGGGVISNLYIRSQIRQAIKPFNLPVYLPYSKKLLTDNAAMIAAAGYYRFVHDHHDSLDIDALPTWPISEL